MRWVGLEVGTVGSEVVVRVRVVGMFGSGWKESGSSSSGVVRTIVMECRGSWKRVDVLVFLPLRNSSAWIVLLGSMVMVLRCFFGLVLGREASVVSPFSSSLLNPSMVMGTLNGS